MGSSLVKRLRNNGVELTHTNDLSLWTPGVSMMRSGVSSAAVNGLTFDDAW